MKNIKLKNIMNEGISNADFDNIFHDTDLFPTQVEAVVQALRLSSDLILKLVEELKNQNPAWNGELQKMSQIRNIISKSDLMRKVDYNKNLNIGNFNSAANYIQNHLPRKKKH